MLERMAALHGPVAALVWVSAANVLIGLAALLVLAVCKAPPRTGPVFAFVLAFVGVYARSYYRNLHGGPVTWWGAGIHALIGVACVWMALDAIRHRRRAGW